MSTLAPACEATPFISAHIRARIADLWQAGRNTHEIAQHLAMREAAVADVVREQRERRLGIRERAS